MKKLKVSSLEGPALDWAVAKCEGALHPTGNVQLIDSKWLLICVGGDPNHGGSRVYFNPSTDWSQGGPIIEREQISIDGREGHPCRAFKGTPAQYEFAMFAPEGKPLIAAMRCYVASKLGNEIEIPEELCQ